ncbi:MAG: hypothetical protein RIT07_140 [Bacteroidota bacterium]|jgi:hypothetical protein
MRLPFLIFILIAAFWGCKKDEVSKSRQETLSAWMNLKQGNRSIYRVDSLAYRRDKTYPDTFSFEWMETVDTLFEDNVKELVARIKIVTRKDSQDFWKFRRMYYSKVTDEYYERVEENVRYLKVSFPLAEEAFWNMNSRNNLPATWLFYENLNTPYREGFIPADSALTVVAAEIDNNIEKYSYREVYGKGIGLLFKENVEMLRQGNNWDGYKRTQKLVYAD